MKDISEELEGEIRTEKWHIVNETPDYYEVGVQLPLDLIQRCEALIRPIQNDKRGGSIGRVLKITPGFIVRLAVTNGLTTLEEEYLKPAKVEKIAKAG